MEGLSVDDGGGAATKSGGSAKESGDKAKGKNIARTPAASRASSRPRSVSRKQKVQEVVEIRSDSSVEDDRRAAKVGKGKGKMVEKEADSSKKRKSSSRDTSELGGGNNLDDEDELEDELEGAPPKKKSREVLELERFDDDMVIVSTYFLFVLIQF
jgi:hypothetical protein